MQRLATAIAVAAAAVVAVFAGSGVGVVVLDVAAVVTLLTVPGQLRPTHLW